MQQWKGFQIRIDTDATIVTMEESIATFIGRKSSPWVLGSWPVADDFEALFTGIPYDRPVCLDADQVMSQPEMLLPCLPVFSAVQAALVEQGFIVAVLAPEESYGSFVVVFGGAAKEYRIGEVVMPSRYEGERGDSR